MGNNQGAVYFWKTQIFKEADKEARERKHRGVGDPERGGLWISTQGTLLITGEGNGNSAEFVGTQIRARILLQ